MERLTRSERERIFFSRIDRSAGPDGCWLWTLTTCRYGYGKTRCPIRGRSHTAASHRVAYTLLVGPIPEGKLVLHKCDNPPCCNPAHLFVGTDRDNANDKVSKGRQPKGETNGNAVLTAQDVRWIRWARAYAGTHLDVLGAAFGVSGNCAWNVVTGRSWRAP